MILKKLAKKMLTYFARGSITVRLTFLTGLYSTKQTGDQLYSDTSPYEVSVHWPRLVNWSQVQ